jgi:hypothetical protein
VCALLAFMHACPQRCCTTRTRAWGPQVPVPKQHLAWRVVQPACRPGCCTLTQGWWHHTLGASPEPVVTHQLAHVCKALPCMRWHALACTAW